MKNFRAAVLKTTAVALLLGLPALAGAQLDRKIQNVRPNDKRGLNIFEAPKLEIPSFDSLVIAWGVGFTQDFQNLTHKNTAAPNIDPLSGKNLNELIQIGPGFNNEMANLYLNAQIYRGIRVHLASYLSTRHHQETWVKDGYLLVDASPVDKAFLNNLMQYITIKFGHFEINYGDAHFRRTDGGNSFMNPFVGNLLMDAFTTEVGGELYVRKGPFLAMGSITNGEIRGSVLNPGKRKPSYIGKLAWDHQVDPSLRLRLSGSLYKTDASVNNTLYSGSRAGAHYFDVLESVASSEKDQAWSGDVQPGFRSKVTAMVFNPFIKFHGLEFFGNVEQAEGRTATEADERKFTQTAGDLLYRFLTDEKVYVGGRYNTVKGRFAGFADDAKVDRWALAGGWFLTNSLLMKLEYVNQKYRDFPTTDIRNGGQFKGFMIEGSVAF
jgi:hypothetical protein